MLLHHDLLRSTAAALGSVTVRPAPDALLLDDPFLREAGPVLLAALRDRAAALYADPLAQTLAAHLLLAPAGRAPRPPGGLTARQLRAVEDHVEAHGNPGLVLSNPGIAHLARPENTGGHPAAPRCRTPPPP